MTRAATAWQWYASINDDVRYQLIDRAWFGQYHRDPAFEQDVAQQARDVDPAPQADQQAEAIAPLYEASRQHAPESADLYGQSAQSAESAQSGPNIEPEPS